jgi:TolA-binding protein
MSRNRKSQSVAIRFGPALKAFLLCLLIGGSGVGYVWQQDQIAKLGRQIKTRETCLEKLQIQNEMLRRQLDAMCSFRSLQRRIQELNLGLVEPQPGQILRLAEPPRAASETQLAADHTTQVMR